MKKQLLTITCFLLLMATAFCQSLKINADKAIVDFNFVSEKTVGTVKGIDAKINFNASKLTVSSIEGSADITTLSTENNMRDKHLQQEDMFSCSTGRHVFLLNQKTCLLAQRDDMFSFSTRRHVISFNKKTCRLVQQEDMKMLRGGGRK